MQKLEMTTVTLKSQNNVASSATSLPPQNNPLRWYRNSPAHDHRLPTNEGMPGAEVPAPADAREDDGHGADRRPFHVGRPGRPPPAVPFGPVVSPVAVRGGLRRHGQRDAVDGWHIADGRGGLRGPVQLGPGVDGPAVEILSGSTADSHSDVGGRHRVPWANVQHIRHDEQLSSRSDEEVWAKVTMGSVIVLLGCILHSGFFVLSDRSLRGHHTRTSTGAKDTNAAAITPPLWSSCLGSMEATTMATYIIASISARGFHPEGTSPEVCSLPSLAKGFCSMLLVDAVHSAAFFLMLKQIGAVGSALLKGVQSVAVVLLSAAFFCPREEAQCLTIVKALSVALVLIGTFLYAVSSSVEVDQNNARGLSTQKNDLPSVEIESLLE
eukprot:CAMPEP_0181129610 /NCGR_PEP_ID=MMETSP1071-20121207/29412_1 /TAXON_ID=35127 /ORGANISM="Thalassiosira sp., Strain NH16" /LENGTH=381 /DNA_ID=CAMNT_0023215605 /DNA_START=540 /DNA_END=1686 /DNA_ORIENTATION=+